MLRSVAEIWVWMTLRRAAKFSDAMSPAGFSLARLMALPVARRSRVLIADRLLALRLWVRRSDVAGVMLDMNVSVQLHRRSCKVGGEMGRDVVGVCR